MIWRAFVCCLPGELGVLLLHLRWDSWHGIISLLSKDLSQPTNSPGPRGSHMSSPRGCQWQSSRSNGTPQVQGKSFQLFSLPPPKREPRAGEYEEEQLSNHVFLCTHTSSPALHLLHEIGIASRIQNSPQKDQTFLLPKNDISKEIHTLIDKAYFVFISINMFCWKANIVLYELISVFVCIFLCVCGTCVYVLNLPSCRAPEASARQFVGPLKSRLTGTDPERIKEMWKRFMRENKQRQSPRSFPLLCVSFRWMWSSSFFVSMGNESSGVHGQHQYLPHQDDINSLLQPGGGECVWRTPTSNTPVLRGH